EYPASNLLKPNGFAKWQINDQNIEKAIVEFRLPQCVQISRIDLGNNSSGIVEILVKRTAAGDSSELKNLLPAVTLMSPGDAKSNKNCNKVVIFGNEKFVSTVASEKWDFIRVVCSQPFNKNLRYGLSFIKFYSPESVKPAIIEDEEEDPIKPGALFRASKAASSSTPPAAPPPVKSTETKKVTSSKPMAGVVFSLSGYQNP
ncbi:X-ray repair complementing defective repair in Chinese hamster cells 1, partial [Cichlidogyrus casuarinus]